MMGLDAMILVFWMLSYKPTFLLSEDSKTENLSDLVVEDLFSQQFSI